MNTKTPDVILMRFYALKKLAAGHIIFEQRPIRASGHQGFVAIDESEIKNRNGCGYLVRKLGKHWLTDIPKLNGVSFTGSSHDLTGAVKNNCAYPVIMSV